MRSRREGAGAQLEAPDALCSELHTRSFVFVSHHLLIFNSSKFSIIKCNQHSCCVFVVPIEKARSRQRTRGRKTYRSLKFAREPRWYVRAGAGDERLLQEAELYPTEVPPKKGHALNAANIVHDTSPRHDDFKMLAQMSVL